MPSRRNVTVTGTPTNLPPVADFTFSCVQNVCSFDGRSSTDENPATLTYSWNFGQGSGSGPVPTKTYTAPGTFTVTLTVRDENGLTGVASQTVTIVEPAGNLAPIPVINAPVVHRADVQHLRCRLGRPEPRRHDHLSLELR